MTILLYDLVGRDGSRPFSPHCWKAKMALAHKVLAFETVPTRFTEVPAVEAGFFKTIPVIRDGETLVADSFAIALYLDEAYPERRTLFGGEGGKAMARFVERWSQMAIHPYLGMAALIDVHDMQDDPNRLHFRRTREARFGRPLEEVVKGRESGLEGFRAALEPLRSMLSFQPWIGGASPLFPDYIVFGAFQWMRTTTRFEFLAAGDPVAEWFDRCLGLFDGLGRSVAEAA